MPSNEMSLENLGLGSLFTPESIAAIKPMPYTGPYPDGSVTATPLRLDVPEYDYRMKEAHSFMYRGLPAYMALTGTDVGYIQKTQDDEMMRLLGLPDKNACFMYFTEHGPADPEVVEALLNDALTSGKWKELPDALQDEYHKRVSERGAL